MTGPKVHVIHISQFALMKNLPLLNVTDFKLQALEATKQVLDLSNNKRVDVELLDTVMKAVEESALKSAASASHCAKGHDIYTTQTDSCHSMTDSSEGHDAKTYCNDSTVYTSDGSGHSEPVLLERRESEFLMDMLGSILGQVSPPHARTHARTHPNPPFSACSYFSIECIVLG